jgi:octaprenyl-diphosphate synthase
VRGKNLGEDLAEGKPTLPLIHALRGASAPERAMIRAAISQEGEADLGRIVECIERSGGIEYTRERAMAESRTAVEALADVPPSPWRDALSDLAGFAVSRDR